MSVRIRLARIGKKKAPFFRIVAIDGRAKRDGQFLENLGTFNPLSGEMVQYHAERIQAWVDKGAIPSDSVVKLQRRFKKSATGVVEPVTPVKKQAPKVQAAAQTVKAVEVEAEGKSISEE